MSKASEELAHTNKGYHNYYIKKTVGVNVGLNWPTSTRNMGA